MMPTNPPNSFHGDPLRRRLTPCFLHRRWGCLAPICLKRKLQPVSLKWQQLASLAVRVLVKQVIAWAVRAFLLVVWLLLLLLPGLVLLLVMAFPALDGAEEEEADLEPFT